MANISWPERAGISLEANSRDTVNRKSPLTVTIDPLREGISDPTRRAQKPSCTLRRDWALTLEIGRRCRKAKANGSSWTLGQANLRRAGSVGYGASGAAQGAKALLRLMGFRYFRTWPIVRGITVRRLRAKLGHTWKVGELSRWGCYDGVMHLKVGSQRAIPPPHKKPQCCHRGFCTRISSLRPISPSTAPSWRCGSDQSGP
jgi:hypothetical protein